MVSPKKWAMFVSREIACGQTYLTVGQYMYYVNVGYMPIVFHTIISPSCYCISLLCHYSPTNLGQTDGKIV